MNWRLILSHWVGKKRRGKRGIVSVVIGRGNHRLQLRQMSFRLGKVFVSKMFQQFFTVPDCQNISKAFTVVETKGVQ